MTSEQIFNELFLRYPQLEVCKKDIIESYHLLKTTYKEGGTLLTAGNGGSAADSEHIVGELMKSFLFIAEYLLRMKKNLKNYMVKRVTN